jgi:hypothetical protein
MTSWFEDTDVDDIPDNPNELPNDTYKMQIISAKLGPTNDGKKTGIIFKYQIIEGPFSTFFPLVDWVQVPDSKVSPDNKPRMLSYIKMRLLAWGFSIEEIGQFGPKTVQECVSRRFYGTTSMKKQDGNTNIRVMKFDPIDGGSDDTLIDFPDNGSSSSDDIAY